MSTRTSGGSVATKTVKAVKASHEDHPIRMKVAWVMLAVGLAFWAAKLFGLVHEPHEQTTFQNLTTAVVLHGPMVVALGFFGWELPSWVKSIIPGKQQGE